MTFSCDHAQVGACADCYNHARSYGAMQHEALMVCKAQRDKSFAVRDRLLEALRPFAEGANSIMFRKAMLEAGMEDRVKEVQAAADAIGYAEDAAEPPGEV